MAAKAGTLLSLAALSATIAAFVPGVFEPARAGSLITPIVIAAPVPSGPMVSSLQRIVPVAASRQIAGRRSVLPSDSFAPRVISEPRRKGVPIGCERLVSPLARSASAAIGRCIT